MVGQEWRGIVEIPDLGTGCAHHISFALTPNSAASERVFSLLKLFFGPQQDSLLADQIEVALMLAYNNRVLG